MERLGFEAEAIGFHLTAHPLDVYAKALRRLGTTPCAQVEASAQAGVTRVRLAGMVAAQKERVTRTGNRMAWVRISDASGSCEVTLFAEVLSRARDLLANGSNVLVTADLRQDGEALRVTAQDVASLDQAAAAAGAAMRIWLRETASVPHIRDLLGREGARQGPRDPGAAARHHAKRGDRAARRLQRHAAAGAGAEGDPRRRAGRGTVAPRYRQSASPIMQWPIAMPTGNDSVSQTVNTPIACRTKSRGSRLAPHPRTVIVVGTRARINRSPSPLRQHVRTPLCA